MGNSKQKIKISNFTIGKSSQNKNLNWGREFAKFLLLIFLLIFPLGQLLRIDLGQGIIIQPVDLVAFFAVFFVFKELKKAMFVLVPLIFGNFLWMTHSQNIIGFLYLLRILSFISFYFLIKHYLNSSLKKLIPKLLILESIVVGLVGFLQYVFMPDFRSFKAFGWDDHFYRLIGTFLDPTFVGIILCLGFILAFMYWIKENKKSYLLSSLFLMICLAFTYSRASMLSLMVSIFLILILKRQLKLVIFLIFFVVIIFTLPKHASEGTDLGRVASILGRVENYKENFQIFIQNPVFGVGINNLCEAKIDYFKNNFSFSHSCSGSDSSILYLLATTGIVGFSIVSNFVINILKKVNYKIFNNQLILVSLIAIFIHSQFSNSLVYPWVMGWMAILAGGLGVKTNT